MPTPLLFLSGAGLPSWIWDDVRNRLQTESRVVEHPRGDSSLRDYATAALQAAEGWESFGIVAHSIGGVVASEVVALEPDRVSSVVAVSASVPPAGRSFLAALPAPQRHVMSVVIRLLGTRPPAKEIRDGLCKGVPTDVAQRIVDEFAPESKGLYRDAVSPRSFPAAATYALTSADTQFPLALQQKYAAELGGTTVTLATAHLPMIESPDELAAVIATAGQHTPGP